MRLNIVESTDLVNHIEGVMLYEQQLNRLLRCIPAGVLSRPQSMKALPMVQP